MEFSSKFLHGHERFFPGLFQLKSEVDKFPSGLQWKRTATTSDWARKDQIKSRLPLSPTVESRDALGIEDYRKKVMHPDSIYRNPIASIFGAAKPMKYMPAIKRDIYSRLMGSPGN